MHRRALLALGMMLGQARGASAYEAFLEWKGLAENKGLAWAAAIAKYRALLVERGVGDVEKTLAIIEARDEGVFYDPVYASATRKFLTAPNRLLVEAVKGRKPGRALDVGMGQGRNAIYLARMGWDVTGFDTSAKGLEEARRGAIGLRVRAVLASDLEFDFGNSQWDLIAILYPIEKRSVYRVRSALRAGGIVVLECGYEEAGDLLGIFAGFRILKYEDAVGEHEWARKRLRMVRIVAEK